MNPESLFEEPNEVFQKLQDYARSMISDNLASSSYYQAVDETAAILNIDLVASLDPMREPETSLVVVPVLFSDPPKGYPDCTSVAFLRIGRNYTSLIIDQAIIDSTQTHVLSDARTRRLAKLERTRRLHRLAEHSNLILDHNDLQQLDRWHELHRLFQLLPDADQRHNGNLLENWRPLFQFIGGIKSVGQLSKHAVGRVLLKTAQEFHHIFAKDSIFGTFSLIPTLNQDGNVILFTTSLSKGGETIVLIFTPEDAYMNALKNRNNHERSDDEVLYMEIAQRYGLRSELKPNVSFPRS